MKKRKSRTPTQKQNRRCWCGAEFTVTNKDALNLLDEFDLFCSDKCVIDYINQTTPIPISPMLAEDMTIACSMLVVLVAGGVVE